MTAVVQLRRPLFSRQGASVDGRQLVAALEGASQHVPTRSVLIYAGMAALATDGVYSAGAAGLLGLLGPRRSHPAAMKAWTRAIEPLVAVGLIVQVRAAVGRQPAEYRVLSHARMTWDASETRPRELVQFVAFEQKARTS